jgi:hypothetical protein
MLGILTASLDIHELLAPEIPTSKHWLERIAKFPSETACVIQRRQD